MSDREKLLNVIRGLMVSENQGDIHDQLDRLCDIADVGRLEGDFLDGWTDGDWQSVGGIDA